MVVKYWLNFVINSVRLLIIIGESVITDATTPATRRVSFTCVKLFQSISANPSYLQKK